MGKLSFNKYRVLRSCHGEPTWCESNLVKSIGVVHSGSPEWVAYLGVIYLGNQVGMQLKNFMSSVKRP